MYKVKENFKENSVVVLNVISKLVQDIEEKVSVINIGVRECKELKQLKEKCCDSNAVVSLSGFHGIEHLVEKRVLTVSEAVALLISLLPSVKQYGALVSTIGRIILFDFRSQINSRGEYECPFNMKFKNPFIIILGYNLEKSWFEVYNFVLYLMQRNENIKLEHKVVIIRPVYHFLFWSSTWRGLPFQLKLFHVLLLEIHGKIIDFVLETFLWQKLDIHYCLFLEEFFIRLLKERNEEVEVVVSGTAPLLAVATCWLITNGHNPSLCLKLLGEAVGIDFASGSTVLFMLTDVMMETPSIYISGLIDVCKSIIFSCYCSKYVTYKFLGVILNWFVRPSFLVNPIYKELEEILYFITKGDNKWNDQTFKLNKNKYYTAFGSSKKEVKFTVDLILTCECLNGGKTSVKDWLKNLADSKEYQMQFKIHSFIHGILLCENDSHVIHLCLDILFKLIDYHTGISFSLLCLLFYKLSRETDPNMQKLYLHSLPKLSVKKENISLIVKIIESLKRGSPKIMTPLVIQLYLWLWKFDSRIYSYLHEMLHDSTYSDFGWELNVSKAMALKEICQLSPHLYAKDLVGVLSKILNECSGTVSGLPSAIAIEAVTKLCKAYVIDVAGTWNAIQPKLRVDKRPKVIISLCKFFAEIPNLKSSEEKNEELMKDIVPMLWNYTFFKNMEVVKSAFSALSNLPMENLPLKLFPKIYWSDLKLPSDFKENSKNPVDILNLPYVPAEFWLQFLSKIKHEVLQEGGQIVIVLLKRELGSLPRGIFHHPPEKLEPLNYSYLPSRSICRSLVAHLQRHLKENPSSGPEYLKEIIRALSYQYAQPLPPLNWTFLKNYMSLSSEFLRLCLTLLAKQAPVSPSAKSVLENYFESAVWNHENLTEVLHIYEYLPRFCKSVSCKYLQTFLAQTMDLCLRISLEKGSCHFEKVLQSLIGALKNESVQRGPKDLIVGQMERILILIPPEHEVMKTYATCASELPYKSIEKITSIENLSEMDSASLRRAVTIKCDLTMRSDNKNPLVWVTEFMEAVAQIPEEQKFVLNKLCTMIRNLRSCEHRIWIKELTQRIQESRNAGSETSKVTLFLIDVFVTSVVVLSGCDCLFVSIDEFLTNEPKKLEIFPQALCFLYSQPEWNIFASVGLLLHDLSTKEYLSQDYVRSFVRASLILGDIESYRDDDDFVTLFTLSPVPPV